MSSSASSLSNSESEIPDSMSDWTAKNVSRPRKPRTVSSANCAPKAHPWYQFTGRTDRPAAAHPHIRPSHTALIMPPAHTPLAPSGENARCKGKAVLGFALRGP
jgi:hypothetical protein